MAKGSSSTTVPANDTFSVAIPLAPPKPDGSPAPYRQMHIECKLNTKEAEGLGLLRDGVYSRSLKYRGELHCNTANDALRWMLAEIAERHAAAMSR